MKEYLFVYGTLAPHRAPADVRAVVEQFRSVSTGSMPGRVYALGDFPGAVYDRTAQTRVHGEVFEVPTNDGFPSALDDYEECVPGQADASLFIREKRPIQLADGSQLPCWVYLYNRDPGQAPLILSGHYSESSLAHQTGPS